MTFPAQKAPARPDAIAPGSALRSMLCDATMLVYPLPAFLLPLLHPATAHSTAVHDIAVAEGAHVGQLMRRVVETFDMVGAVVYGGDEADRVAQSIRDLHRDLGGSVGGESYHPWSRELWTWNWAAITAAIMGVYGAIRGWPSERFRAEAYLGMVEVGRRFGVLGMPASVEVFDAIWPAERDRVADTDSSTLRRVASTIRTDGLAPPPRLAWLPTAMWAVVSAPLRHLYRVSIRAAVPPAHRRALGLPVGRRDDVYLAIHRLLWRLVPRTVTHQMGVRYFDRLRAHGRPVWRTRFSAETLERRRRSSV
ncbi:MAG: oxygenase MpaB family protein [Gordonia paraffinivorans]